MEIKVDQSPARYIHTLTFEPQPIADQWMGKCSCGWRATASFYEHDTREDVIEALEAKHRAHVYSPY